MYGRMRVRSCARTVAYAQSHSLIGTVTQTRIYMHMYNRMQVPVPARVHVRVPDTVMNIRAWVRITSRNLTPYAHACACLPAPHAHTIAWTLTRICICAHPLEHAWPLYECIYVGIFRHSCIHIFINSSRHVFINSCIYVSM